MIYHVLMAGGGSFLVYAGIAALLFFSIPVLIMLGYIVSISMNYSVDNQFMSL